MIEYKVIAEEENKRLGLFYRNSWDEKFKFTNKYLSEGSLYNSILDYILLSQRLPLVSFKEYEVIRNFPFGPNGEIGEDYIRKDINLNLLSSNYQLTEHKIIHELVDLEKIMSNSNEIFFDPEKPRKYYCGHIIKDTNYKLSFLLDRKELLTLSKAKKIGYISPDCPEKIKDLDEINPLNYIGDVTHRELGICQFVDEINYEKIPWAKDFKKR